MALKKDRLARLESHSNFRGHPIDVSDLGAMEELFQGTRFDRVIHLVAQAGVKYSIDHPHVYMQSNLTGFMNVLECCRHHEVAHLT